MNTEKKLQELTKNIHHWYVRDIPNDVKGMARVVLDSERHMNEVLDIYKKVNAESQLTPEIQTLCDEASEMVLTLISAVATKVNKKEMIIEYVKAYDTLKEQDAKLKTKIRV